MSVRRQAVGSGPGAHGRGHVQHGAMTRGGGEGVVGIGSSWPSPWPWPWFSPCHAHLNRMGPHACADAPCLPQSPCPCMQGVCVVGRGGGGEDCLGASPGIGIRPGDSARSDRTELHCCSASEAGTKVWRARRQVLPLQRCTAAGDTQRGCRHAACPQAQHGRQAGTGTIPVCAHVCPPPSWHPTPLRCCWLFPGCPSRRSEVKTTIEVTSYFHSDGYHAEAPWRADVERLCAEYNALCAGSKAKDE